jgi:hypothetical protein
VIAGYADSVMIVCLDPVTAAYLDPVALDPVTSRLPQSGAGPSPLTLIE